jgi:glycosyltransferase involved in cell wall biosynthesis
MGRSSLLLNMSEREGLSIITLESLALGVPVMLPSYSPIPPEVKDMCIVKDRKDIPSAISDVLKGAKTVSPDTQKLEIFSTSNVIRFYNQVFAKLGLMGNRRKEE